MNKHVVIVQEKGHVQYLETVDEVFLEHISRVSAAKDEFWIPWVR